MRTIFIAITLTTISGAQAPNWRQQLGPIVAQTQPKRSAPAVTPAPTAPAKTPTPKATASNPVVRTQTRVIHVPVPQRLREPTILVNGKLTGIDAILKDDRVYVSIAQLPEVLAQYGVTSYAEYSPKTNILQWSVSASSRARTGTLGAGLEALWRGDVSRAKHQLEQVRGPDSDTAGDILRSIAVLGDRPENMGVVRFNWAVTPQRVTVLLEETEVPAGTLMMVVPIGSRLITFQDDQGPFQTARIQVRAGQATNVTISPSL